ncbi:MAG TPA: PH domain-containing protein [Streptosporangiaceae bacterium]
MTSQAPGRPPVATEDITTWHRLHPLSPLVRTGRHLATIGTVLILLLFANHSQAGGDLVIDSIIVGLVLIGGVISWLVTRWHVADGVLRIETGLIRRESRRFPLSQVQAIDVVQTGLARVLGLAELRLRMAGADSSGGRLASLPLADAEALRQRLLSMAHASGAASATAAPGPGAAPPPGAAAVAAPPGGRVLFRVRSQRLAGAIILSRTGALAAVVIAAAVAVVLATGHPGTIVPFLPFGIGFVLAVWRQFNGEFGTVVATAPEGLRLRSGLVQTTAETIRPGRVQAVRIVEPLVWRAFGWCRLEVDVAGPRQRRENQSESQRLRAVIPVGSRAEAEQMTGELLSTQRRPTRRPPPRARWKAPLSYHFLAFDSDDRYVVASRGRVCRKTTWVPLEKVQSVRWVQGPYQRRLDLATVFLDVAGRRVRAAIEDRDTAEAGDILGRLPDLARAARGRAGASRAG